MIFVVKSSVFFQAENKLVLRYFSPLSGKMTTTTPYSISSTTFNAATMAAPQLIPTNIPSSKTILRAIS
jgi:hypothetical protein